jgi:antitoxin (DNA-binding transcriptional repressor) of toxin-antitoxin stability system
MKTVTVDELPKLLGTVLAWLKAGESVELRDHEERVATIQPENKPELTRNQQWALQLEAQRKELFGDSVLTPEESAFIRDRGDY